jgi:hypothetical protein
MKRHLQLASLALLAVVACSSPSGDPPTTPPPPTPLGAGLRIKQVTDPSLPNHPNGKANPLPVVTVTAATVIAVDTFDETANGKSRGTTYVQDVGSQDPWSAISLYSPTFVPGDLRLAPGDVLDLTGGYQENDHIGTAIFPAGQVLTQLAKPIGTFRYEYQPPVPREIDPTDLDDYTKGSKWVGMLVIVKNIDLSDGIINETSGSTGAQTGRRSGHLTPALKGKITNELIQLDLQNPGTRLVSLTGVVTYFFDLHIAPRSIDDIVFAK